MSNPWDLSEREGQVLTALAEHGCSKLAGHALGISPKTVDVHMQHCMVHMGARNRLQAVLMWDRWVGRMPLPELADAERTRINGALLYRLQLAIPRKAA